MQSSSNPEATPLRCHVATRVRHAVCTPNAHAIEQQPKKAYVLLGVEGSRPRVAELEERVAQLYSRETVGLMKEAISAHQRSSEVIRGHQRIISVRPCRPACRRGGAQETHTHARLKRAHVHAMTCIKGRRACNGITCNYMQLHVHAMTCNKGRRACTPVPCNRAQSPRGWTGARPQRPTSR